MGKLTGYYAIYNNKEYECNRHKDKVELYSDIYENGFAKSPFGIYYLELKKTDVERIYRRSLVCKYKGDVFAVKKKDKGRVLLMSGPRSYLLSDLGFTRTDYDSFEKWIDISEAENIYWEEEDFWGNGVKDKLSIVVVGKKQYIQY